MKNRSRPRRASPWTPAPTPRPARSTMPATKAGRPAARAHQPRCRAEQHRHHRDPAEGDQRHEPVVDPEQQRDRDDGQQLAHRPAARRNPPSRPSSSPPSRRIGTSVPNAVVVRAIATGGRAPPPSAASTPTTPTASTAVIAQEGGTTSRTLATVLISTGRAGRSAPAGTGPRLTNVRTPGGARRSPWRGSGRGGTAAGPARRSAPSAATCPRTIVWSPPSYSRHSAQSIQAHTPSSTGAPDGPGRQGTPAYLSVPDRANWSLRRCWSSASTLMQNRPLARIRGHVDDVRAGLKLTSGGSSDSERERLAGEAERARPGPSP